MDIKKKSRDEDLRCLLKNSARRIGSEFLLLSLALYEAIHEEEEREDG